MPPPEPPPEPVQPESVQPKKLPTDANLGDTLPPMGPSPQNLDVPNVTNNEEENI